MSRDNRRSYLLDTCLQLVESEGFGGVTIAKVAATAGVSRTVIYQQFGGLAEMLVALVQREHEHARISYLGVIWQGNSAVEAVCNQLAEILNDAHANPTSWRIFLFPSNGGPPELYAQLAISRRAVYHRLIELITSFTPHANPDAIGRAAKLINTSFSQLVQMRLTDPATHSPDQLLTLARVVSTALLDPLTTST